MVNNTGTTSSTLPRTIGEVMEFDQPLELASIAIISGELGPGFLLFDNDGTMSVCTEITSDEEGNLKYKFMTTTLDTEVDIQNLLSQNY